MQWSNRRFMADHQSQGHIITRNFVENQDPRMFLVELPGIYLMQSSGSRTLSSRPRCAITTPGITPSDL
ncbi:hypothetical protein M404DRAFT_1002886, partial [Pisolithus tinctorius Marx 270]